MRLLILKIVLGLITPLFIFFYIFEWTKLSTDESRGEQYMNIQIRQHIIICYFLRAVI